jgi:hypothetical protein
MGCVGTPQIEPHVAHHQKTMSGPTLIVDTSALRHFLQGGEMVTPAALKKSPRNWLSNNQFLGLEI